jgi:iron(III) transport system ATP-binding protein
MVRCGGIGLGASGRRDMAHLRNRLGPGPWEASLVPSMTDTPGMGGNFIRAGETPKREAAAADHGNPSTQDNRKTALQIVGVAAEFKFRHTVVRALDAVDLTIPEGEFLVLLGPSGCGKTTMLRSIAGLQKPAQGVIRINDELVFSSRQGVFVPPERRPIAMVFQSYAIWPHMNVFENVAFPLRDGIKRLGRDEVKARAAEVLTMLGLETVADRPVTMLSGGQQQRVALARALALRPKILLMDEPLSNLDYKLQIRLRSELRELMHRLRLTTVYVTHNQSEAIEIGDRVAVMDRGRIVQIGNAHDIYHYPRDEFVARFIGEMNLVPAKVERVIDGRALLSTEIGQFLAVSTGAAAPGGSCLLGIRPQDVVVAGPAPSSDINLVRATVASSRFSGEGTYYRVRVGAVLLDVRVRRGVELREGDTVTLRLPPEFCVAVRRQSDSATDSDEPLIAPDAGGASAPPS